MKLRLSPIQKDTAAFDIVRELSVVGRKEDCEVFIDNKGISKQHCLLLWTHGVLILRDLGSTNGTRVNGIKVRRATLLPRDLIYFANVGFELLMVNEDFEKTDAPKKNSLDPVPRSIPSIEPTIGGVEHDPKEDDFIIRVNTLPDEYV